MGYIRNVIRDFSDRSLMELNKNMEMLWLKCFGDISMQDVNGGVKDVMYSNWLQPQGEGNLDLNNPLVTRFFIPPDTKKIKQAKLNVKLDRYKLDSDVAVNAPATSSGTATSTSTRESTSESTENSDEHTHLMFQWSSDAPFTNMSQRAYYYRNYLGEIKKANIETWDNYDIYTFSNSKSIHKHNFTIPSHAHTVNMNIEIPEHGHALNMGIKKANVPPTKVQVWINGVNTGQVLSGDGMSLNEFDMTEYLNINAWNTIEFRSGETDLALSIARVTTFSIVELLQKYY